MDAKCLCEKIHFKFEPRDGLVLNCCCSICRRAHGAGYATQVLSSKDSLEFISGESLLKEYASSAMGIRAFCSNCGSRLMNYAKQGSNYLSVCLSAVVDDHELKAQGHVQVASKAPWVYLNPDIPCHEKFPDSISKYLS